MNLRNFWPFHAPAAQTATAEAAAPSEAAPAPLCAVFSAYSPVEAHLVSAMLQDSGIECVLSNELFTAADGPVANATGGVQVFVRASDADQARALIHAAEAPEGDEAI